MVVAPTLSPTTPVQFNIVMDPWVNIKAYQASTGSVLEEVGMGFAANGSLPGANVDLTEVLCDGDAEDCFPPTGPLRESAILTTYPGATISLAGDLDASGNAEGSTTQSPCTPNPCFTNDQAESGFEGTVGFFVVPLTAGASYISASGTSYLTTVPEPSTKALLLAGLVLVVGAVRRRAVYAMTGTSLESMMR
jgi:hypothetical protein